jgi:hypothetical protein
MTNPTLMNVKRDSSAKKYHWLADLTWPNDGLADADLTFICSIIGER